MAFFLAFVSWYVAIQTVSDIDRLNEPPRYERGLALPMESLTDRFLVGGVILLVFAGITRIGLASLLNLQRPSAPGMVLNALVYFVLGLILLGQVRYINLQRRWQAQGVTISKTLPTRWIRYSFILTGLAALLAFLLPTGYSMGLLETAGFVLQAIIFVLLTVFKLILFLMLLPLAWLMSLFGAPPPAPSEALQVPDTLPISPPIGPAPDWWQVIRSLLFWILVLGVVFYVVRNYLRDHPELLQALLSVAPFRALRRLLATVRRWLGGWMHTVGERLPRGFPRWLKRQEVLANPFGFIRLGALSPRERVLYYYLSIVQRAGQLGFPRRPAQTPDEYQDTLEPKLPQLQHDVSLLTQAFVEARYSRHTIESDLARRVRVHWQRVKMELQRIKRQQTNENPSQN
jgi:hypothetical protein